MNRGGILIILLLAFGTIAVQGATTYYSRQNGSFNSTGAWSTTSHSGSQVGSAPCGCAPCSIAGNNSFEVDHAITISCDMSFSGNLDIHIHTGGSLSVTGNASISGSVIFIIDNGATVDVSGNFSVNGGGGYVTVNGTLNIGGNLTINGSYPVCGTGTISYGGSLSGSGNICGTVTVLPVEWLYFAGRYFNQTVQLSWGTASETNNDYFTVQKSADGDYFSPIATVDGAGNSSSIIEYACNDLHPAQGINYYRIKQTDFDGHYDYSGTIALFISADGTAITISPTLVTNHAVHIYFTGMRNRHAEILLSDINGKILKREETIVRLDNDRFTCHIPASLSCAFYFLTVSSEDFQHTEKIVVE